MKRASNIFKTLLLVIGISTYWQPLMGQSSVQHIRLKDTIKVMPGKVFTLPLSVVNPFSYKASATITPVLPPNWEQLVKNNQIEFDGKEAKTILRHLYVESTALAGSYNVQFEVRFDKKRYIYHAPCIVMQVDKVSLSFGAIPSFIKAGDSINTTLHVSNLGNVEREFVIVLTGIDGKKQKKYLTIAPATSSVLRIQDASKKDVNYQRIEYFRANVSTEQKDTILAYATTSTHVIPQKEKPYDQYLRVPSYVGGSYFGRHRHKDYEGGWQAEAYGFGYLDESQRHELEYRLRGPDRYYISSMGNYAEYFIKYRGPRHQITVGDDNYRLSNLTEYARYGRGVYLSTRWRFIAVGGYYVQPRFYPDMKQAYAAFGEIHFWEKNKIRANYVRKQFNVSPTNTHVYSVEGSFFPFKKTEINVEYARSRHGKKRGEAYYANFATNSIKSLIASGYFVYAGKDFHGYYNNSLHFGGNAVWNIGNKWNINAGISKTSYNVALDTLFTQAPTRQNNSLGIGFKPNKTHRFTLQGGYRSGKDRLQVKRYAYEEYFGRLNHHLMQKKIRLFSTIELSKTENLLAGDENRYMWRKFISESINYQVNSSLNVGAFASYSRHNRYSEEARNYLYVGVSGNLNLAQKTRLMLRAQNSFSIEDDYQDRSYFDLYLSHFFTPRHELVLQNRYALPRKHTQDAIWEFGIQYRFHFGLPVGRKSKHLTSLKGRVDADPYTAVSRSNILLHMSGKTVYTDKQGFFEFKNMPSGNHFLFIDKSNMPLDVVAEPAEPIEVTLNEKDKNFLPIRLYYSAQVSGKITIREEETGNEEPFKSSAALEDLKKAPEITPIIVELSNGEKSYKRITDKNGAFEFRQIIPGDWKLKIYPNGLSAKYKLTKSEFDITLKAGENRFIEIPIYPKGINIKFKPASMDVATTIK